MDWFRRAFKSTMSSTVGTPEPIYGADALHSVANQTKEKPWTELTKDDMKWSAMEESCVETQTFYLNSEQGHLAMLQVIYSVISPHTAPTCRWNVKIFSPNNTSSNYWNSSPVDECMFDIAFQSFGGDDISIQLSEDGMTYTIIAMKNEEVDIKVTRLTPPFMAGKDGTTGYGYDKQHPWGTMKHWFWPRCKAEGSIATSDGEIDFKGQAFFVHALQGMKPHHLASSWNFANFQGPRFSACYMEFTTPPSYDSTKVAVGGIAEGSDIENGKITIAGSEVEMKHTATRKDPETGFPEPKSMQVEWKGKTKEGKEVSVVLAQDLGERYDRIDIMAQIPDMIKSIIGRIAYTKPFVYQFIPKAELKLRIGDEEIVEKGLLFAETSFVNVDSSEVEKPAA